MCCFFRNRTRFATGGPFSPKNGPVCALGRSLKVLAKQIKSCVDKNIKNHCLYKLKRVIGNAEHCLPQLVTRFWDDSLEAVFYASVVQSGRLGVLSGTPGSLQGSQTLRFKADFGKLNKNDIKKMIRRCLRISIHQSLYFNESAKTHAKRNSEFRRTRRYLVRARKYRDGE